jgi:hypothetical protein
MNVGGMCWRACLTCTTSHSLHGNKSIQPAQGQLTEEGADPLASLRQRGARSLAYLAAPVFPLGDTCMHMTSLRQT